MNDWGIGSGERLATYTNNAMYPILIKSWQLMDGTEGMGDYLQINRQKMYFNEQEFNWKALTDGSGDVLTVEAVGTDNATAEYTLDLAKKDGHYVITMKENSTGAYGLYYYSEYGYENSWQEYIYPRALEYLEHYVEYGSFWSREDEINYEKHAAGAYLYDVFSKLGSYRDSAEIVNRFTIVPGMLKKVVVYRTDNLGNDSNETLEYYDYDEKGRMIRGYSEDITHLYGVHDRWDSLYFSYDNNDKIDRIQYGNVTAVITPSYDEAGRLTGANAQYNTAAYEYSYTYNEAGQLISNVNYDRFGNERTYTYSYDEAGRILQCTEKYTSGPDYTVVIDYSYDEKGNLSSKRTVDYYDNHWDAIKVTRDETITYISDEKGRPASAQMTVVEENKYTKQDIEYTYTDLYFYDAE